MDDGHFATVEVHFDDLDAMGVLHNSRYALLVERATNTYWQRLGWSMDAAVSTFPEVLPVVREFMISFAVPVVGAGERVVHLWLDRLGTTSVVYGFRVLSDDRSVVHAQGHRVVVNLDPATLRPAPISDTMRASLVPLLRDTEVAAR
ncbi:acyl-CoA thioesterase [Solihabitans fulvus]|nr:thioesterase family protein [Solihabitans fulvus]